MKQIVTFGAFNSANYPKMAECLCGCRYRYDYTDIVFKRSTEYIDAHDARTVETLTVSCPECSQEAWIASRTLK